MGIRCAAGGSTGVGSAAGGGGGGGGERSIASSFGGGTGGRGRSRGRGLAPLGRGGDQRLHLGQTGDLAAHALELVPKPGQPPLALLPDPGPLVLA